MIWLGLAVGGFVLVAIAVVAWLGPVGWIYARMGLRYHVGPVEHVLPALDFGGPPTPLLKPATLAAMREVLGYTHGLLAEHGITHWLTTGTLLGAVRHGGFVPWDDDIDLQVPLDQLPKLESLGSRVERDGYVLLRSAGGFKLARRNRWRFPYVDLVVVAPHEGRMALCFPLGRDGRPTFEKARQWPRECFRCEHVFPLTEVSFEDLILPAPGDTRAVVDQLFGRDALQRVRHRRLARWHNHLFMMTCFRLGLSGG